MMPVKVRHLTDADLHVLRSAVWVSQNHALDDVSTHDVSSYICDNASIYIFWIYDPAGDSYNNPLCF